MDNFKDLTREQLEKMVSVLTDVCFEFADSQTLEHFLIEGGFENEELSAIGFDVSEV